MSEQSNRTLDWALTALAVVVGAYMMAAQGSAAQSREAGPLDVRALEMEARVVGGADAIPSDFHEAFGFSGERDKDELKALKQTIASVRERYAWSDKALLVTASIAVGFGEDTTAIEELDRLADKEGALERWRAAAENLYALARGQPADDIDLLRTELSNLGASVWLVDLIGARHATNAGANAEAVTLRQSAASDASDFVSRLVVVSMTGLLTGLIGAILLLIWPLVRRSLGNSGYVGIGGAPAPFDVYSTQRVMVVWLLGFMGISMLVWSIFAGAGGGPQMMALGMATITLLNGGLTLFLIQRFGRNLGDLRPLKVPLRLGFSSSAGGPIGLALWCLGGIAVMLVVVTGASILNVSLLGAEPDSQQPAMEMALTTGSVGQLIIIGSSVVIFAPLFEEILFRGFLYRNLRERTGPVFAMLTSGFIFGLFHLDPVRIIPLAAIGATLAWLYERSGTLVVPIVVHALWNLSQLAVAMMIYG